MIWILRFYLAFFLALKRQIFVNFSLDLSLESLILFSVIPLNIRFFYFFNESFSLKKDKNLTYIFFFLILSLVSLTFFSTDPFKFIFFLECSVLPISFIIIFLSKDYDKISSVLFITFINLLGSIPFIMFLLISNRINFFELGTERVILEFIFILVIVCKIPIFFFHFWLNKAHVAASGYCSMILARIMLKLGTLGLFKFFSWFKAPTYDFISYILGFSTLSSLIFSMLIIRFLDFKNLVACSSILHISMIFPIVLSGRALGVESSLLIMVGHGIVSIFLFFLVTILYERLMNRSIEFNKSLESLNKSFCLILIIYVFLNLGVPPLINFIREIYTVSFLLRFSVYCIIIFLVRIVFSIIFLIFLVTKILFSKKYFFLNNFRSNNLLSISFFYLNYRVVVAFLV